MQPATHYTLLQIPGWILVGFVVALLLHWAWIDAAAALVIVGLWLFKDLLLYPLYRPALVAGDEALAGASALMGRTGWCRTEVNGRGLVEIHGERWLARSLDGTVIGVGNRVEVVDREGMTLRVRCVPGPDPGTDPGANPP